MGHSTRRLMMGAAGAGGDPTYVEDVFSTYLYTGTSANQRIDNGLKVGNANAGNSVDFGGFGESSDYLQMAHTTDLCFGNGDFTIECWAFAEKHDSWNAIIGNWNNGNPADGYALETVSGDLEFYWYNAAGSYTLVQGAAVPVGEWSHLCVCRSGNTLRVFVNGTMYGSGVSMTEGIRDGTTDFTIGGRVAGGGWWDGNITNLRVTKGQALYTANFTPSTEPFTTTSQGATASNVKLLCCNKDTVTGSTVTPGTITAFGSPTASNFGTGTASDGEGGLVWLKSRTQNYDHWLFDTVRGTNFPLRSNSADAATDVGSTYFNSFNNSGFTVGSNGSTNYTGVDFSSWTFRKQKGFFDVVTYTGTGVTQNIAHNLGSVPGSIFVKRTDSSHNWGVYHRGLNKGVTPERYRERLNVAGQEDGNNDNGASYWANTAPTSTHFTVSGPQGSYINTNISGATYVAYIFAGGESTADNARSVDFNGSSDYLSIADNSDFALGSNDFTFEAWIKIDALNNSGAGWLTDWNNGALGWFFGTTATNSGATANRFIFGWSDTGSNINTIDTGYTVKDDEQWHHYAVTRSGTNLYFFVDGNLIYTHAGVTESFYNPSGAIAIGQNPDVGGSAWLLNGKISNLRLVNGTAVYTESFTPPTEPLKSITNTVLLCCNNSSVTGSTTTPSTITAVGSPTAISYSPFDDPEGYKFGEEGDQNIIKCGSVTTQSWNGALLELPWEPQWFLFKQVNANTNWTVLDCMRGWTTDGTVQILSPNLNNAESGGGGYEELKARTILFQGYGNNYDFIYMAIRRPDGLVGKPAKVGTEVFNIANYDSTAPAFNASFPVDMGFFKRSQQSNSWRLSARLIESSYLETDNTNAGSAETDYVFDYNDGWNKQTGYANTEVSWMWKRGVGFDVVTDKGNGQTNKRIAHGLGVVPQMIWRKNRDGGSDNWQVYHMGLNGGTNPHLYRLYLDTSSAEMSDQWTWDSAPTSTHFTVGSNGAINRNNQEFITMLFASVAGVSKVGSYNGSTSNVTLDLGFQPRFIIVKARNPASGNQRWQVMDTLRGMTSGSAARMYLDDTQAQQTGPYVTSVSSTGITLATGYTYSNTNGYEYIYYAHA